MSSNKTKPTATSVHLFLEELVPEEKKADSWALYQMMVRLTGARGILWGTSIIGFGDYHHKYASGREGDWFLTGFFSEKMPLHFILCVIFPTRNLILKPLENTKKAKVVFILKS